LHHKKIHKLDESSCKFLVEEAFTANMADNKHDTDNTADQRNCAIVVTCMKVIVLNRAMLYLVQEI